MFGVVLGSCTCYGLSHSLGSDLGIPLRKESELSTSTHISTDSLASESSLWMLCDQHSTDWHCDIPTMKNYHLELRGKNKLLLPSCFCQSI